jgi:single-strand DNA-binding protein
MVAVRKKRRAFMLNLNRVELLGNIASDPTVRSLQDGRVCNLRIATNETWKDKDAGERRSKAQFHNLTIWNEKLVDFVEKHVRKGDYMFVQAKLEHTTSAKDGDTTYYTNIVVKRIDFAQAKDAEGAGDED